MDRGRWPEKATVNEVPPDHATPFGYWMLFRPRFIGSSSGPKVIGPASVTPFLERVFRNYARCGGVGYEDISPSFYLRQRARGAILALHRCIWPPAMSITDVDH